MASGVGLFGKTQFRKDFLSVGLPRPLVTTWETWATRGLARSRERIGAGWMPLYLIMPIWHAALGRSLCGVATALSVMPSMDGAGRCFPLAVMAWSDEPDAGVAFDGGLAWADAAEAFLLDTLDEAGSHEAVLDALAHLPPFPAAASGEAAAVDPGGSLWWTRGGEHRSPSTVAAVGMPDEDTWSAKIGDDAAPVSPDEEDQRHVG